MRGSCLRPYGHSDVVCPYFTATRHGVFSQACRQTQLVCRRMDSLRIVTWTSGADQRLAAFEVIRKRDAACLSP